MALARAVVKVMERIAPLRLAEKWDNVGLLLESPIIRHDAKRVLLTIDLTPAVLSEALSGGIPTSLIIAYHPPIFKPLTRLTLSNPLQTSLLRCAAEGISVYSPHSALDSVLGGVNDWLAGGLSDNGVKGIVEPLRGVLLDSNGVAEGGEGRRVKFQSGIEMSRLEQLIKAHTGVSQLQVACGHTGLIQTVAICAGSGGSMLLNTDADVYWTGEMSHHEVLAAVAAGKNVVLAGHTNTERGYLQVLASKLENIPADLLAELTLEEKEALSQMEVRVSEEDKHPLVFA